MFTEQQKTRLIRKFFRKKYPHLCLKIIDLDKIPDIDLIKNKMHKRWIYEGPFSSFCLPTINYKKYYIYLTRTRRNQDISPILIHEIGHAIAEKMNDEMLAWKDGIAQTPVELISNSVLIEANIALSAYKQNYRLVKIQLSVLRNILDNKDQKRIFKSSIL